MYRLQTVHIILGIVSLIIFSCLGIMFIIDLFMFNNPVDDEENTNRLERIGLLTSINLSPFLCRKDARQLIYQDSIVTSDALMKE